MLVGYFFLAGSIFEKLNHLNLSLQGENENIITMTCKLKSFEEKLKFWITKAHNSELDIFAGINSLARKMEILTEIQETLKNLDDLFGKYFPSLDTKNMHGLLILLQATILRIWIPMTKKVLLI